MSSSTVPSWTTGECVFRCSVSQSSIELQSQGDLVLTFDFSEVIKVLNHKKWSVVWKNYPFSHSNQKHPVLHVLLFQFGEQQPSGEKKSMVR